MSSQDVSGWYKDAEGVWHETESGGSTGCGGGWYQDTLGVWHEEAAAEVTGVREAAAEVTGVREAAAEVTGVSVVQAESREVQGSPAQAHGYALPFALGMPISGLISGLPSTELDPAALALVVPEVVVPEHATCLGALLNGGMGCTPHFVPGKVRTTTLTLTLSRLQL